MRRGLTMLELLISLGLLAMMMGVVTMWTRTASDIPALAQPARWQSGVEAVFDLIEQDLLSGDFAAASERGRSRSSSRAHSAEDHVEVIDHVLRVRTRDGAPATHEYRLDPVRRELLLVRIDEQSRHESRLLLDNLSQWQCALVADNDDLTLTITMAGADGIEHIRRFRVP